MADKRTEALRLTDIPRPENMRMEETSRRPARRPFILRMQKKVFIFLQWPCPVWSWVYHIFLCVACLNSFCLTIVLSEYEAESLEFVKNPPLFLIVMESLLDIWIYLDFALRLYSCGCTRRFQGFRGNLRFCLQFLSIIDIIVIFAGPLALFFCLPEKDMITDAWQADFSMPGLIALFLVQLLRLCRFARLFGRPRILLRVLTENSQVFLTLLQIWVFLVLLFSVLIHNVEFSEDSQMTNLGRCLYWALITLTTVGYGDVTPVTAAGKAFGCLAAIAGVCTTFVPVSLLAAGVIQKMREERHLRARSRTPAAILIQSTWRMRRGGVRRHNVVDTILFMKLLAAQKKFRDAKKSSGEGFTQKSSANSHELICAMESRMIMMEKAMARLMAKVDQRLSAWN